MMHWNYGLNYGFMGGSFMMWVLLLALGILFFYTIKNSSGFNKACTVEKNSLDILKERLAKGEIDEEEYERKKQIINNL